MACNICGAEADLNENGLCGECAAKLSAVSDVSSHIQPVAGTEFSPVAETDADRNGGRPSSADPDSNAKWRVIAEFGQSDGFQLANPFSVALDHDGDLLIMDRPERNQYRVSQFSPEGEFVRTLLSCEKGSGPLQLRFPKGIATDLHGNVYIPDAGNNRIQRFDRSGESLGPIGVLGDRAGELCYPCDVDIDDVGILYVADTQNNRVQKLTPQGISLLILDAANGEAGGRQYQLDEPTGVTVDKDKCIYVVDTNNHRVMKFSSDGELLLNFGTQGTGPGQLKGPSDVRVTDNGDIYVADMDNDRVQVFDSSGTFRAGFSLEDSTELGGLGGDVAIDSDGGLFICNTSKNTVAKVEFL